MTKRIRDMLSQGDYANVLETAFEKYNVDQLKMFRRNFINPKARDGKIPQITPTKYRKSLW